MVTVDAAELKMLCRTVRYRVGLYDPVVVVGGGVGLGWVKASSGPLGPRTSPFPARHNWSGRFTVVRSQGLPD